MNRPSDLCTDQPRVCFQRDASVVGIVLCHVLLHQDLRTEQVSIYKFAMCGNVENDGSGLWISA